MNFNDVPQAIQLALAPVFLLTGIAGILNVMTGRLARIIDRGRVLTETNRLQDSALREFLLTELHSLELRRHQASTAITATTASALLVCMVVVVLFVESLINVPLRWLIGLLFTAATLLLVVGLALFLREVHVATRTVRIPVLPGD